jgi:hypothetical protein
MADPLLLRGVISFCHQRVQEILKYQALKVNPPVPETLVILPVCFNALLATVNGHIVQLDPIPSLSLEIVIDDGALAIIVSNADREMQPLLAGFIVLSLGNGNFNPTEFFAKILRVRIESHYVRSNGRFPIYVRCLRSGSEAASVVCHTFRLPRLPFEAKGRPSFHRR